MLKLGCKGNSSSRKNPALLKKKGLKLKILFFAKEKCLEIQRNKAGSSFLCSRKLYFLPHQQKLFETLCSVDAVSGLK